jgi:hypothetical protein
MSDKPDDVARRAHAMNRLGGIIFKSQSEIDQKAIDHASSPDDERFVEIAERVKAYLEEVGIEIRFCIQHSIMHHETNLDFNVVSRPWIAEMLVIAWHSAEKRLVDKPTVPHRLRYDGEPIMTDVIRITFGQPVVIEYSLHDLTQVMTVLAAVRDRLIADHEDHEAMKPGSNEPAESN